MARARNSDIRPLTAWILALALFFTYAALQPGVISRDQIGTLCADTLPLAAVALGEGIVILTAGIDLSVGGVLSLGTALAATHFTNASTTLLWSIVILAIGVSAGAFNGLLVGRLRLQPFIVTLATWSIFDGIALQVLPTQGGSVPSGFLELDRRDDGRRPQPGLGADCHGCSMAMVQTDQSGPQDLRHRF